jgi:ABC-2 type transport system permease protein
MMLVREFDSIVALGFRDVLKFVRDPRRIVATFIFPIIFIGVLGGSLQANLGEDIGYNFLLFTFIGVLAQTLFQSTAAGIISLTEDRENDFAQEVFVSPISRYGIIMGKILGESVVAFLQTIGIVLFGVLTGVPIDFGRFGLLLILVPVICFFGGSFGVFVVSQLGGARSTREIFPFVIFPQFFLAGVFNPIVQLPLLLSVLSYLAPMRYAVDLLRGAYYWGRPEYVDVVAMSPLFNFVVLILLTTLFMVVGTWVFVKKETNR